jgi:hypothetical protein
MKTDRPVVPKNTANINGFKINEIHRGTSLAAAHNATAAYLVLARARSNSILVLVTGPVIVVNQGL